MPRHSETTIQVALENTSKFNSTFEVIQLEVALRIICWRNRGLFPRQKERGRFNLLHQWPATGASTYFISYSPPARVNPCWSRTQPHLGAWRLSSIEQFGYLNKSGCTIADGINDSSEFSTTKVMSHCTPLSCGACHEMCGNRAKSTRSDLPNPGRNLTSWQHKFRQSWPR